jgi:hypothetical protein
MNESQIPRDSARGGLRARLSRWCAAMYDRLALFIAGAARKMAGIREVVESNMRSAARSSVMGNANWIVGLLLAALVGLAKAQAPTWLLAGVAVATIGFVGYWAYIHHYFAMTNPDNLRSERHSLGKMAIERGLYGDNRLGLVPGDAVTDTPKSPPALLGGPDSGDSAHG